MQLEDAEIVSVDIEGNGRQPPEIVEIAVVHLNGIKIGASQCWLLRPTNSITWQAKQIHGIRNADLVDSPPFTQVQDQILTEIEGRYLLAHNASIECTILQRYFPTWKALGIIDTLALARRDRPDLHSHRLEALIEEFDLGSHLETIESGPHRALFDAFATAYPFRAMMLRSRVELKSIADVLAPKPPSRDDSSSDTGEQMTLL